MYPSDIPVKVFIFIGERQQKISVDLAVALQRLGANAQYIRMSGQGQNALDFHMAFWIGRLAERDPQPFFYIVSKDTGFDPLVAHLKAQKIFARRITQLSDIHFPNRNPKSSLAEKIAESVRLLKGKGNSRPRRTKTLRSTIASIFMKALSDKELDEIIKGLLDREIISVQGDVVTYNFADEDNSG